MRCIREYRELKSLDESILLSPSQFQPSRVHGRGIGNKERKTPGNQYLYPVLPLDDKKRGEGRKGDGDLEMGGMGQASQDLDG